MTDAPKRIWVTASTAIANWMRIKSLERVPRYEYHLTDLSADLVRAGYLAGLEAVSKHLVGIIASHKAMGAHGTYPTLRETTLKSVSTLPIDPEAIAAIVARVTEGK